MRLPGRRILSPAIITPVSYKTVRELFDHVGRWQKRVAEFCEEVADRSASDQTTALMDYFAGHERELKRLLSDYTAADRDGVLNTWIQHTSEDDVRTFFKRPTLIRTSRSTTRRPR